MKHIHIKPAVLVFLLILLPLHLAADEPDSTAPPSAPPTRTAPIIEAPAQPEPVRLASWNVRILSDKSRDDEELALIAGVIDQYDIVALQECRDLKVLDRLMTFLDGWDYIASEPVGGKVREIYAYLFRTGVAEPLGDSYLYPDPGDLFLREPFIAHFSMGNFDCTLITIHVIYGSSIKQRRAEVAYLDDVVKWVDEANGPEEDIILLGDFNLPYTDHAWDLDLTALILSEKTTITDTSSYDNIFISESLKYQGLESAHVYRFDEELFGNNDSRSSLMVSDHRPVSIYLDVTKDYDLQGNWSKPE